MARRREKCSHPDCTTSHSSANTYAPLCPRTKEERAEHSRNASEYNRIYHREIRRFKKYGITKKMYESLLAEQGGGCAICGRVDDLAIDHNHETAQVRGILCRRCNAGMGQLQDDPELLKRAAYYLGG